MLGNGSRGWDACGDPNVSRGRTSILLGRCAMISGLVIACLFSQAYAGDRVTDLTELSLEDLMDIEVSSVSKKMEKASDAAAAVYVLTGEEIKQSGVTTIPDALRMVPGLHVAGIDASSWGVCSRGFNGYFSNKLLVLIDGRTVYNPLFSGVWWDVQDVMMEDIDRIEVIRGPGATLWGANAVNGVINIITRHTRETEGTLVAFGAGTSHNGIGGFQTGGQLAENSYLRVFAKHTDHGSLLDSNGASSPDQWRLSRGGFRYDTDLGGGSSVYVMGDVYGGDAGARYLLPILDAPYLKVIDEETELLGGNILAKMERKWSDASTLQWQFYYDFSSREDSWLAADLRTFDVDFHHSYSGGSGFDFIWGLGYRHLSDEISNGLYVTVEPSSANYDLFSGFAQGSYDLIPGKLRATLGTKLEHNEFTGFEVQPNARLLWHLSEEHTLWSSVARAVRTPSRGERNAALDILTIPPLSLANPNPIPVMVQYVGSERSESESMIAYELGYRLRPGKPLSFDVALFYNDYENLLWGAIGEPRLEGNPPTFASLPIYIVNSRNTHSYGAELASDWYHSERFQLRTSYSYLWTEKREHVAGNEYAFVVFESTSPRHQFRVNSVYNFTRQLQLSTRLRFVDELPQLGVRSYTELDARIGFRLSPYVLLSLAGHNLLHDSHTEFTAELARVYSQVERTVLAKVELSF